MKNKLTIIFSFLTWFIFSIAILNIFDVFTLFYNTNKSNKPKVSVTLNKYQLKTGSNVSENRNYTWSIAKMYSFEGLYKVLVIDNWVQEKWSKDLFRRFVLFFNTGFDQIKYYFFNGDYTVDENWKVIKRRFFTYPNPQDPGDEKNVKLIFKKFNSEDLSRYKLDNFDVLFNKWWLLSNFNKNILFYNKKKNYFFWKQIFYNINWLCRFFEGSLSSFKDISDWTNVEYDGTNIDNIFDDVPGKFYLSKDEYKKFLTAKYKINDRLFVLKWLLTTAYRFVKSWYDKRYERLFYKKFDEQLSPYYSYAEYALYFSFKKYDWLINPWFCDNFNREYFLWK